MHYMITANWEKRYFYFSYILTKKQYKPFYLQTTLLIVGYSIIVCDIINVVAVFSVPAGHFIMWWRGFQRYRCNPSSVLKQCEQLKKAFKYNFIAP